MDKVVSGLERHMNVKKMAGCTGTSDDELAQGGSDALTARQCIIALLLLACLTAATIWAATAVAPLLRAG